MRVSFTQFWRLFGRIFRKKFLNCQNFGFREEVRVSLWRQIYARAYRCRPSEEIIPSLHMCGLELEYSWTPKKKPAMHTVHIVKIFSHFLKQICRYFFSVCGDLPHRRRWGDHCPGHVLGRQRDGDGPGGNSGLQAELQAVRQLPLIGRKLSRRLTVCQKIEFWRHFIAPKYNALKHWWFCWCVLYLPGYRGVFLNKKHEQGIYGERVQACSVYGSIFLLDWWIELEVQYCSVPLPLKTQWTMVIPKQSPVSLLPAADTEPC